MEKIKNFINFVRNFILSERGESFLIITIVILTGIGSFGLGRISMLNNNSSGIKVEYLDDNNGLQADISNVSNIMTDSKQELEPESGFRENKYDTNIQTDKLFFASKKGKKFYSINCSAGKSIKMKNRIYFSSREEAQNAGYQLSDACK